MTGPAVALAVADALLTGLLSLVVGIALFSVKRYADRQANRDAMLTEIRGDMRSLREGMSVGAREAISHLAGRVDILEDAHEQLVDKVADQRTEWRVLESTLQGHIRAPGPIAHPASYGPQVAS